ncbi:MAG: glycosyltransferase family 2 protein [Candidatus Omnitrophica bacterium]|nr:glycosyltransferase family 2 protein [Candidatus Omnitrophota bacterium]
MLLSIIIPVYNEERTLEALIQAVKSVHLPSPLEKEIVIINDGSKDQTDNILKAFEGDPQIRIFHFKQNQGKTAAVKYGFEKASGDILLIQDADMEYSPENYEVLLSPILKDNARVVYGSRFKGDIERMEWINRLANLISCWTFSLLYKVQITDINTCFKVFRKEVLKAIEITSQDFSFETEITAKLVKQGFPIVEVPIRYVARTKEDGKKITWGRAWTMYWEIIRNKYRS